MKFQDYYTTLGVARTAGADEIKRAYRKLAKEWHPDKHPADKRAAAERRFAEISEANEVLSDPEKRKRYDALGQHWRQGQDFQPPPGGGYRTVDPEEFARMFGGAGGGGFSDFFSQMFGDMFAGRGGGGGGRARTPQRGRDVEARISIDVGVALLGGKQSFAIQGAEGSRSVDLTIPKLSRDGQVLRLRGLGQEGAGGKGDLLLKLELHNGDVYRRRGNDVEADVTIAPWELLDGTAIEVAVPGGTANVKIKPGTRPGERLRLRGQGLPRSEGGAPGDLLLVVRLGLPENLTERQQELLRELGKDAAPVRGGAAK
ncbi:MAG: J domain-containing protein [Planctomycetes bacterium]|nr:J domain-containing protein [Planctomycetota bacterium]